jgi:DNA-binding SARP family transcriptional activator
VRVVTLLVELLGRPRLVRDGAESTLRGRKNWALLTYLVLSERPPSRERLAALLFPDADDPLGALRWSLSQLRRALGERTEIDGDPVVLRLPPEAVVDVDRVRRGSWTQAVGHLELGGDLLEGIDVEASPAFELWLANERRRCAGAAGALLHEAALAALASGATDDAIDHASRLIERHPLEEANHVLLVRCLVAAGALDQAREHVRGGSLLLRRELGREPSPALQEAADVAAPVHGVTYRSVPAMLEVAAAAIAAGAVTPGLRTLGEAAWAARRGPDRRLLAEVLLARGRALVHVGRGGDEEGGAALHEAAAIAHAVGDPSLAAVAHRELAFADLQRGRYDRARRRTAVAAGLADGDDSELSHIEAIDGVCLSDQGHHGPALARLRSAIERAERSNDHEGAVFAWSFLGRSHLLRGELTDAGRALEQAVATARASWLAFSPLPESLLAEVELRRGEVTEAETRFDRAFAAGRQLEDPCLESISLRGLGLVAVTRGRVEHGYRLLVDAPRRSRRLPDSYLWIEAYGLDALCSVSIQHAIATAQRWVDDLDALASRCGMRELAARALLHRSHLGEPGAAAAARELVATIDNPTLGAELTDAVP